jgi:hypothetical protein
MHLIFAAMVLFFACFANVEHAAGQATFQRTIDNSLGDVAEAVEPTNDMGFILAGTLETSSGLGSDMCLVKCDSGGAVQWNRILGQLDPIIYYSEGLSVQQTSDGGYIVAGEAYVGGFGRQRGIVLMKTDANGAVIWQKSYAGTESGNFYAGYIWARQVRVREIFDEGGYIVIGQWRPYFLPYSPAYGVLLKIDAAGGVVFSKRYITDYHDDVSFTDVRQNADGGFTVLGYGFNPDGVTYSPMLMRTDTTGAVLWCRFYNAWSTAYLWSGSAMEFTAGGDIVFIGPHVDSANWIGTYMMKTDGQGLPHWLRLFGSPFGPVLICGGGVLPVSPPQSLRRTADDGFVFSGVDWSGSLKRAAILRTDANGVFQWARSYAPPGVATDARHVVPLADGGFVLTGRAALASGDDMYLVRTDSMGSVCDDTAVVPELRNGIPEYTDTALLVIDNPGVTDLTGDVTVSMTDELHCGSGPFTFTGGQCDCFDPSNSETATPSPALVTYVHSINPNPGPVGFDDTETDHWFVHTFTNLPRLCNTRGVLCFRARPIGGNSENDTFTIGRVEPDGSAWPQRESHAFASLLPPGRAWNTTSFPAPPPYSPPNCGFEFCLNLSPHMLSLINQYGTLDFYAQDDTAIDCLTLTVFPGEDCCTPPPRNMVAWLPFDELSGTAGAVTDNVLALADGVLGGTGAWLGSPGKVDRAVCFDPGHVDVPYYEPGLGLGLSLPDAFTLDAWIQPTAGAPTTIQTLVDKRQQIGTGWRGHRLYLNSGVPTLEVSDGATPACTQVFSVVPAVPPGSWHHVAVMYHRATNTCTFALDGICTTVVGTGCVPTTLSSASPLRVGDSLFGANQAYYGCIDELEVFPRVLSCGEIQAISNVGDHGKCKEFCQLYWQKAFCGSQQFIQVPVRLCNGTATPQTYTLAFRPVPGCGNIPWNSIPNGWSTNPPGPHTVAAGGCAIVWITMPRPPFTPAVTDEACCEVCMTNVNTSRVSCCTGSVRWTGPLCGRFGTIDLGEVPIGGPQFLGVGLNIEFTGRPNEDWTYLLSVVGPDLAPDSESVSLNGLPPGTPVEGVVQLSGQGVATEALTVAYRRAEPRQPFHILLQADLDGDGVLETLDSIGIMNRPIEHTPNGCIGTLVRDDLEFYPLGDACGFGTWEEWLGSTDVCGQITTAQAFIGARSLEIVGNVGGSTGQGDDTVRRFYDVTSGRWTLSTMTYVPMDATGVAYINVLNTYDDPPGSPVADYRWSLQVHFDADVNQVIADFDAGTAALVKGRWAEFRVEIDLDDDLADYYYDGVRFVQARSWSCGLGAPFCGTQARIEAIDLYAGEPTTDGTSGMYFDDIVLRNRCEQPGVLGDLNCDGAINFDDINPFVLALGDPAGYAVAYPDCDILNADCNSDGQVDFDDINPFVAILSGG